MKSLTATESYELLKNGKAALIDVREREEYEEAHIKGAQLVPLSTLPQDIQDAELDPNKKLIIHCLKGGRSAQAIEFLADGFLKNFDLYNMEGGIIAWNEAGLPIEA